MPNTIIHLTDNSLDPEIAAVCRRRLLKEAQGLPIISVSQEPLDFGRNICVGKIGRNWRSFYHQVLTGAKAAETDIVCFAEHDCLYTYEHLAFDPPDPQFFWYNHNSWLVQWKTKRPEHEMMYSYWPHRLPFSQLVCDRHLLITAIEEIVRMLEMGLEIKKGMKWYGEPGVADKLLRAFVEAESGRPTQLQAYLKNYLTHYDHKVFRTEFPNLDIRHSSNFTGPKRGQKRCYELPYWGKFEDVIAL